MPSFCTRRWPRWTTRSLWPRKPFGRRLFPSLREQDLQPPLHKYARLLPLTPICPSTSVRTAALEGENAKCATTKLQSCVWLVMWRCASFPSATVSPAGITQKAAVRMRQIKVLGFWVKCALGSLFETHSSEQNQTREKQYSEWEDESSIVMWWEQNNTQLICNIKHTVQRN